MSDLIRRHESVEPSKTVIIANTNESGIRIAGKLGVLLGITATAMAMTISLSTKYINGHDAARLILGYIVGPIPYFIKQEYKKLYESSVCKLVGLLGIVRVLSAFITKLNESQLAMNCITAGIVTSVNGFVQYQLTNHDAIEDPDILIITFLLEFPSIVFLFAILDKYFIHEYGKRGRRVGVGVITPIIWIFCFSLIPHITKQSGIRIVCKIGVLLGMAVILRSVVHILIIKHFGGYQRRGWFEKTVFNRNYTMKKEYKKKLESLPWVKDYYIGVVNKPERSWQLYITHAKDMEPSMADLKEIFGAKISMFVDFTRESNKPLPPRFLRGPRPGDKICTNESTSTTGIIISGSYGRHYATTCYHSCCKSQPDANLPEDKLVAKHHEQMMRDSDENSPGCQGAIRIFDINPHRNQLENPGVCRVGRFFHGLYNDDHDIALIELETDESDIDAINFFRDENIDLKLASSEYVGQLFGKAGPLIVEKIGAATGIKRATLVAIDAMDTLFGTTMVNRYRVELREREHARDTFATEGDSGSLLVIVDENAQKKIPFAYLSTIMVKEDHSPVYGCRNLDDSVIELIRRKNLSDIIPYSGVNGDTERYMTESIYLLLIPLIIIILFLNISSDYST